MLQVKPATVSGMISESRKRVCEAVLRRSMMLKMRIERNAGVRVTLDDFVSAEEQARRKLAVMQTRGDAEYGDGDLPELIASILTGKDARTSMPARAV